MGWFLRKDSTVEMTCVCIIVEEVELHCTLQLPVIQFKGAQDFFGLLTTRHICTETLLHVIFMVNKILLRYIP